MASVKRNPAYPDTPTVAESGYPGFAAESWFGLSAPDAARRDPAPEQATAKAMASAEMRQKLESVGFVVVGSDPQAYSGFVTSEIAVGPGRQGVGRPHGLIDSCGIVFRRSAAPACRAADLAFAARIAQQQRTIMDSPLPNRFRQRILARERLIGFWMCMSSHITAELAGLADFDWLLLDGEHSPNEVPMFLQQLQALQSSASAAVGRPSWNDPVEIKRMLDIGFYC